MNWYEQQRLSYIDECLRVFGYVNRIHIMRKFRCSESLAALDMAKFCKTNPDKTHYCTRRKAYVSDIELINARRHERQL